MVKWYEKKWVLALASVVGGLLVGAIVLAVTGYNPFQAYGIMVSRTLGRLSDILYVIIRATPLILTGLSVTFAFRTGLFNIGAEGQYIVGSLVAAIVGVYVPLPGPLHLVFALLSGMAAGALWGAIAGFLKARFGVHEVIATIMLNWTAFYMSNWIISRPGIKDPVNDATPSVLDSARLDFLGSWKISAEGLAARSESPLLNEVLRVPFNGGIILAVVAVVIIAIILKKSVLGYELKAVGHNRHAAEYGGISVGKSFVTSMGIAGLLAGLAGAIQVLAVNQKAILLNVTENNGFDGIAVALIGMTTPWGTLAAGMFFGFLRHAGPKIQAVMRTPTEIINIMMGVIVFFMAIPGAIQLLLKNTGDFFGRFKRKKPGGDLPPPPAQELSTEQDITEEKEAASGTTDQ